MLTEMASSPVKGKMPASTFLTGTVGDCILLIDHRVGEAGVGGVEGKERERERERTRLSTGRHTDCLTERERQREERKRQRERGSKNERENSHGGRRLRTVCQVATVVVVRSLPVAHMSVLGDDDTLKP